MPDEPDLPFPEPSAEALPSLVEALLFVSDGPAGEGALARALGVAPRALARALAALEASLEERGVRLQRGPEGVQLITAPHAAAAVEHFLGAESRRRLSMAALETLAVVAYRQPVTRAAIEAIRGSSSDATLATLRARGLVERTGRASGPGRPALYGTTQRFLEHFGLRGSGDLPGLDELAERLGMDRPAGQPSLPGDEPPSAEAHPDPGGGPPDGPEAHPAPGGGPPGAPGAPPGQPRLGL